MGLFKSLNGNDHTTKPRMTPHTPTPLVANASNAVATATSIEGGEGRGGSEPPKLMVEQTDPPTDNERLSPEEAAKWLQQEPPTTDGEGAPPTSPRVSSESNEGNGSPRLGSERSGGVEAEYHRPSREEILNAAASQRAEREATATGSFFQRADEDLFRTIRDTVDGAVGGLHVAAVLEGVRRRFGYELKDAKFDEVVREGATRYWKTLCAKAVDGKAVDLAELTADLRVEAVKVSPAESSPTGKDWNVAQPIGEEDDGGKERHEAADAANEVWTADGREPLDRAALHNVLREALRRLADSSLPPTRREQELFGEEKVYREKDPSAAIAKGTVVHEVIDAIARKTRIEEELNRLVRIEVETQHDAGQELDVQAAINAAAKAWHKTRPNEEFCWEYEKATAWKHWGVITDLTELGRTLMRAIHAAHEEGNVDLAGAITEATAKWRREHRGTDASEEEIAVQVDAALKYAGVDGSEECHACDAPCLDRSVPCEEETPEENSATVDLDDLKESLRIVADGLAGHSYAEINVEKAQVRAREQRGALVDTGILRTELLRVIPLARDNGQVCLGELEDNVVAKWRVQHPKTHATEEDIAAALTYAEQYAGQVDAKTLLDYELQVAAEKQHAEGVSLDVELVIAVASRQWRRQFPGAAIEDRDEAKEDVRRYWDAAYDKSVGDPRAALARELDDAIQAKKRFGDTPLAPIVDAAIDGWNNSYPDHDISYEEIADMRDDALQGCQTGAESLESALQDAIHKLFNPDEVYFSAGLPSVDSVIESAVEAWRSTHDTVDIGEAEIRTTCATYADLLTKKYATWGEKETPEEALHAEICATVERRYADDDGYNPAEIVGAAVGRWREGRTSYDYDGVAAMVLAGERWAIVHELAMLEDRITVEIGDNVGGSLQSMAKIAVALWRQTYEHTLATEEEIVARTNAVLENYEPKEGEVDDLEMSKTKEILKVVKGRLATGGVFSAFAIVSEAIVSWKMDYPDGVMDRDWAEEKATSLWDEMKEEVEVTEKTETPEEIPKEPPLNPAVAAMPDSTNPEEGRIPSASESEFVCLRGCRYYDEIAQHDAEALPEPETRLTRICRRFLDEDGHTELTEATLYACSGYAPTIFHLLLPGGVADWRRNKERLLEMRKGISGGGTDDVLTFIDHVSAAARALRG